MSDSSKVQDKKQQVKQKASGVFEKVKSTVSQAVKETKEVVASAKPKKEEEKQLQEKEQSSPPPSQSPSPDAALKQAVQQIQQESTQAQKTIRQSTLDALQQIDQKKNTVAPSQARPAAPPSSAAPANENPQIR